VATHARAPTLAEQLAEMTGLHQNMIGLLERGKRNPSLETVVKLARGLEVHPSRLFAKFK